ncbi:MAG: class II glutamine amidotransferase [Isosphaeraceae bacterium]
MGELQHECGVAAVFHANVDQPEQVSRLAPIRGDINSVSRLVPRMLLDMQNRGQLAAGMASFRSDRNALIRTHKELGTVAEAFRLNHRVEFEDIMKGMDGPVAIGHVRYATCGGDDRYNAQPFERDHGRKTKWFAFAFNGQLANYQELRNELLSKGDYHLKRDTDTEIIMHSLAYELQSEDVEPDWVGVFGRLAEKFDGAYNIVLITAHGELVVARDPLGFRPLCIAEHGPLFAVASESVPLSNLGFRNVRSLEPGTIAVANHKGIQVSRYAPSPRQAHCFFEWIYFANVGEHLDDRSVYLSQPGARQGVRLETVLDADTIVVPVPDTAKAAADAMSFALKIPSVEGLMRNRHVGRTFIEGTADRAAKARPGHRRRCPRCSRGRSSSWSRIVSSARPPCVRWCTRSATEAVHGRSTCGSPARRSSHRATTASTCPAPTSYSPPNSSTCPGTWSPRPPSRRWRRNRGRQPPLPACRCHRPFRDARPIDPAGPASPAATPPRPASNSINSRSVRARSRRVR